MLTEAEIFYGTRGPRTARVMIVAESWGKTEHEQSQALVGESGQDLDRLLVETKLPYETFIFTNVIAERPADNEMANFFFRTAEARALDTPFIRGLYPAANVIAGLYCLEEQIDRIKPDLIIGLGNYALWALTEDCFKIADDEGRKVPTGIGSWRGSQLYTRPIRGNTYRFLPTYHPAAGLRTYPWRYMIAHDLRVRVPLAILDSGRNWDEGEMLFTIRPSFDQTTHFILDLMCHLSNSPLDVSLDLEFRDNDIACVGLGTTKFSAFCIPFMAVENEAGYFSLEEEIQIKLLLRKLLTHPNIRIIGQNLLADFQMIVARLMCRPRIDFDTMVAHHCCWPGGGNPTSPKAFAQGIQRKALFNLSSLYCDYHRFWKDEIKFWEKGLPEETFWIYNCRDVVKTFECATELKRLVNEFELTEQNQFQHDVANELLLDMMIRGIRLLPNQRSQVKTDLSRALAIVDENLENLVPKHLVPKGAKNSKPWYRSPQKQKTLFYDTLGIKPIINKKTGKPTFSKESLPILVKREPLLRQVADRITFRRSVGVFHNTFAEMPADDDGRMRCSYNLTGTDTFRLSSSENIFGNGGNMQNVPAGKTLGEDVTLPEEIERFSEQFERFEFPNMRKQFGPDLGYEICEIDIGGADAQTVAWEADDEDLKAAFRAGLKLHIKNARDVYPEKYASWSDEDIKKTDHAGGVYHNMKRWVHATNFVGSAHTITERVVGSNLTDVQEFQERWFHLHPGIKGWHQRTERYLQGLQCWSCDTICDGSSHCPKCKKNVGRCVGNKFGFRIFYFDRIQGILPEAVSWTPQSTTAINCNKGGLAIKRNIPWVEMLLQTHDSLTFQYPYRYSDRLGDVKEVLSTIKVPYKDPLVLPWSAKVSRESWGHCEPIKW